ncbi:MAG: Uma2 family endonuclease [Cytophagales bacterium]|nr:Uma2 family endonuclease [Cytophagales bacterium]
METIVLSVNAVGGFNDEEFYNFCQDDPTMRFERDAQGQIIILPNTGGKTGIINLEIARQFANWNKAHRLGKGFDSSTAFGLPNTAVRSPDVAWVSNERWQALPEQARKQFPPLCPDFVIELKSESDQLPNVQKKMQEWLDNGCRLAWLIDPQTETVHVYQPGQETATVHPFRGELSGGEVLPGFSLQLAELLS